MTEQWQQGSDTAGVMGKGTWRARADGVLTACARHGGHAAFRRHEAERAAMPARQDSPQEGHSTFRRHEAERAQLR